MGEIDRLDAVFSQWRPSHGIHIERRRLFPLDMSGFPRSNDVNAPLLNLPLETLLIELVADYVHAQLCNTALHAFAAENEARMEAMASALARSSANFRLCWRPKGSHDRKKSPRKSSNLLPARPRDVRIAPVRTVKNIVEAVPLKETTNR